MARIAGQAPNNRWHQRKDGFRRYIEGFVTALKDDDGQLIGFAKIGQDVTQRRLAEESVAAKRRTLPAVRGGEFGRGVDPQCRDAADGICEPGVWRKSMARDLRHHGG